MSKHTPGPWEVSYLDDTERPGIEADRFSVVIFGLRAEDDCGIQGRTKEEEMANARLIAAAPDLLEAIIELRSFYIETTGNPPVAANKAIAKAKGVIHE